MVDLVDVTNLRSYAGPLTSTFTPEPWCTQLRFGACDRSGRTASGYSCGATIYPSRCGHEMIQGCHPTIATTYTEVNNIYYPASICPVGWETAGTETGFVSTESRGRPAGVWCCPSGLTWNGDGRRTGRCATLITSNVVTMVSSYAQGLCITTTRTVDIGPEKTVSLEWINGGERFTAVGPFVFGVAVNGILLAGQTLNLNFTRTYSSQPLLAEKTSSETALSGPSGSSNSEADKDEGPNSLTIGLAAGLSVGGVLLIGLGVWALLWYRRMKRREREGAGVQATGQHDEYTGKPELGPSEGPSLAKSRVHSPATGLAAEHELSGHSPAAPEQRSYPAELANQQRMIEISGTPRAELEGYSQARGGTY